MNYKTDHQTIRKQLWADIAVAYVSASNSTDVRGAENWADRILEAFDERFEEDDHGKA